MNTTDLEFSRNLGFISSAEQEKLNNSTVAIAGAGGDGGLLAIQLARMGVGSIRLADPEVFDKENINRQATATSKTIGHNKAEVVGGYIKDINPNIQVEVFREGIQSHNVAEFVNGSDLLIDETEFTIHAIGVMLAREARRGGIPNLMAMNIGFASTVTTFHPKGKTFEKMLGLCETDSIKNISQQTVDATKWLPYLPPYGDIKVFETVVQGDKSAPSIAPGVALAAAIGSTQAFLSLVKDQNNKRPKPTYAPSSVMIDAMTLESKVIKHPAISGKLYLAKLVVNNFLNRAPKASY